MSAVFLVALMAMVQSANSADPTQPAPTQNETSIVPANEDESGVRGRRRMRRRSLAPTGDALDDLKQSKRRALKRSRRRPSKSPESVRSANDTTIRLHLSGSFELDFGDGITVRGEGETTTEINHATAARLGRLAGEWVQDGKPAMQEFLKVMGRMPDTLKSTASILRSLADPQAQENLRQVEQVLNLIRQSP